MAPTFKQFFKSLEDSVRTEIFGSSACHKSAWFKLLPPRARFILHFMYHLAVFLYSVVNLILWYTGTEHTNDKGVYLSTWSHITVLIHFFISSIISFLKAVLNRRSEDPDSARQTNAPSDQEATNDDEKTRLAPKAGSPGTHKMTRSLLHLSEIFTSIVFVHAPFVTIAYYISVCPTDDNCSAYPNISVHAVDTILVGFDSLVTVREIRWWSVVWPLLYGLIYTIFTLCMWLFYDNVIYPDILDLDDFWLTFALIVGAMVGVIGLHIIHVCLHNCRLHKYKIKQGS
ncbi:uncharacterized protein [Haliotis asinina]|uniref:uncharacterized protein n=1 Tax=Haliotis asinina TaxID=109174 RepID=UPI003531D08F